MNIRSNVVLGIMIAGTVAVNIAVGQEAAPKREAPEAPQVRDVLKKGSTRLAIRELSEQLQGMIAVRDAETGEFRAPNAAEHAALTGAISSKRAAASTRSAEVDRTEFRPDGSVRVPADLGQLEFLSAQRKTDGSVSYSCANPLHKHSRPTTKTSSSAAMEASNEK